MDPVAAVQFFHVITKHVIEDLLGVDAQLDPDGGGVFGDVDAVYGVRFCMQSCPACGTLHGHHLVWLLREQINPDELLRRARTSYRACGCRALAFVSMAVNAARFPFVRLLWCPPFPSMPTHPPPLPRYGPDGLRSKLMRFWLRRTGADVREVCIECCSHQCHDGCLRKGKCRHRFWHFRVEYNSRGAEKIVLLIDETVVEREPPNRGRPVRGRVVLRRVHSWQNGAVLGLLLDKLTLDPEPPDKGEDFGRDDRELEDALNQTIEETNATPPPDAEALLSLLVDGPRRLEDTALLSLLVDGPRRLEDTALLSLLVDGPRRLEDTALLSLLVDGQRRLEETAKFQDERDPTRRAYLQICRMNMMCNRRANRSMPEMRYTTHHFTNLFTLNLIHIAGTAWFTTGPIPRARASVRAGDVPADGDVATDDEAFVPRAAEADSDADSDEQQAPDIIWLSNQRTKYHRRVLDPSPPRGSYDNDEQFRAYTQVVEKRNASDPEKRAMLLMLLFRPWRRVHDLLRRPDGGGMYNSYLDAFLPCRGWCAASPAVTLPSMRAAFTLPSGCAAFTLPSGCAALTLPSGCAALTLPSGCAAFTLQPGMVRRVARCLGAPRGTAEDRFHRVARAPDVADVVLDAAPPAPPAGMAAEHAEIAPRVVHAQRILSDGDDKQRVAFLAFARWVHDRRLAADCGGCRFERNPV
eukprot:gene56375-20953_t